ncbi:MAG: divergent PAP2 family protein [Heliobacteriaceae bacterium]|nr:divergent PAP2 family protein [Heliobacteriaceae bacterium]
MGYFTNTGYEVLASAIFASFLAQLIKFVIFTLKSRKINFKIFTTTGGMPSAHSAAVMALSAGAGLAQGFNSVLFAVTFGFALIIMYDAAGLRRAAGKTAASLNRIMEDFYKHNVEAIGPKLKELLGHTPVEVFAGGLLGIAVACWMHYVIK